MSMKTDNSFSKRDRLRSNDEFLSIYRGKRFSVTSSFTYYYRYSKSSSLPVDRKIGIVISKKVSKKAVCRNRIKRIIKEFYRCNKYLLPQNIHFIVRAMPPAGRLSNREIFNDIKLFFETLSSKIYHD